MNIQLSNLYNLRDSKRKLHEIDYVKNSLRTVKTVLLKSEFIGSLNGLVHERDKLCLVKATSIAITERSLQGTYLIINTSIKFKTGNDTLCISSKGAFSLIKSGNKLTDCFAIGTAICCVGPEHITGNVTV